MLAVVLGVALAAPAFPVDPTQTQAWRPALPAVGALRLSGSTRTEMDRDTEVLQRITVDIVVDKAGPGRVITVRDEVADRVVQTGYGLVPEEELSALPLRSPGLRWTVEASGEVTGVTALDLSHPSAALQAAVGTGSALQWPAPPKRVSPGDSWTHTRNAALPIATDEVEGTLQLDLSQTARFDGWTLIDGRACPRLTVNATVTLGGLLRIDGYGSRMHATGSTATEVVLDPEDGLPIWSAQRARTAVGAGEGDPRPDIVETLVVLGRR
ncbi:MAG: hypothetical protein ACI8PZ_004065 [Myxococcota bacterium]|jgi:hypothetical protein